MIEPKKIITPWAESGIKNSIPESSDNITGKAGFDKGFPERTMLPKSSGGIPPSGSDFNGIFYEVTNILRYMQAGGQPTFDAALATAIGGYPKGAMVLGSDGVTLWQNQIESNFVDPDIDPSNWGTFDIGLKAQLAALGGASLIGPGVMTRGVDKFSIMQGRSGEHRQDTLTRGLAIELNDPITGSGFAGATNTYMFNRLYIKDDRVDAQNDATPGTKVDGLVVQHDFGGAGARGGRHAAEFMLTQRAATESDNTDRNYVGLVGFCGTNSGDGGTDDTSNYKGAYFGGNFYTTIKTAPFVAHANGCESNVLIDAASTVHYRSGYSAVSSGINQATTYDAAYSVGALGASGAQWRDGLLVGVQNGRNPVSRSIIRGESAALQSLASFSGNIPTGLIVSDTDTRFNFRVDRLEMFYPNASLTIGSKTDASNTPILRAYTDNSGNYAGQLIFNGTSSSGNGNGVCNIQFRQTTVRELVPSNPNTYLCGAAALAWAGGFTQTAFTVTSDERAKTVPEEITDAMLDAAAEVDWCMFQYLDRVEEKGADGARWHFGAIAQRFVEAFERHGLDAHRFGFICYDEWADSPELIGEDGEVISPAVDAGSRYGIRYEQAIILKQKQIERDHKRQIDSLVARIEALESN